MQNAADPKQVKFAEQVTRRRVERFENALWNVMNTVDGRIVFEGLIRRLGVMRSIWDQSARIHYNAGQQDAGHEIVADLIRVDEGLYDKMQAEARAWMKQQERSIDAVHTARAGQREPGRAETGDSDGED